MFWSGLKEEGKCIYLSKIENNNNKNKEVVSIK